MIRAPHNGDYLQGTNETGLDMKSEAEKIHGFLPFEKSCHIEEAA